MDGTTSRVRVMLYLRASEDQAPAVAEAYHQISADLAGTPGLLGNELLREVSDPGAFAVLSDWESLPAFQAWESGSAHRGTTSPLREYQDSARARPFALFEVAATY